MSDFFNWDDMVTQDDNEFITLLPGAYHASVFKVEKKRWNTPGKMNGCPYAYITMEVTDDNGRKAYVNDNLFLAHSVEWKIAQYLTALGLKEKGDPVKADKIEKSKGLSCVVTVECQAGKDEDYKTLTEDEAKKYLKQGKDVYNKVKRYTAPSFTESESAQISDDEFGFGG